MEGYWKILGIAPTRDKKLIRNAYSEMVKRHHPEDDPQGYQRVRRAYEQALRYARGSSTHTMIWEEDIPNTADTSRQWQDMLYEEEFAHQAASVALEQETTSTSQASSMVNMETQSNLKQEAFETFQRLAEEERQSFEEQIDRILERWRAILQDRHCNQESEFMRLFADLWFPEVKEDPRFQSFLSNEAIRKLPSKRSLLKVFASEFGKPDVPIGRKVAWQQEFHDFPRVVHKRLLHQEVAKPFVILGIVLLLTIIFGILMNLDSNFLFDS